MIRASIDLHKNLARRWITGSSPVTTSWNEGRKWLRPDGLLAPGQMHRAGAARRMGRDVVGGNSRQRRRGPFRRLILRRNIIQHRRQPARGLSHAHALARGIILDLVALDLAD